MTCGHNDRLWCHSGVPVTHGHGHLTRAPTPHRTLTLDSTLHNPRTTFTRKLPATIWHSVAWTHSPKLQVIFIIRTNKSVKERRG